MRRIILAALLVLIPTVAHGWTVDYIAAGDQSKFFGTGAYLFLVRNDPIPVYLQANEQWNFIGYYGQVALPDGIPGLGATAGFDQVVMSPGGSMGAPDALGTWWRPPVKLERGLQLSAAVIATATLRLAGLAVHRWDTAVILPSVTVHVWWQCAGVATMLLLVGLALLTRRAWIIALAVPLALLENGLRVAAIGLLAEYGSVAAAVAWHDWIGYGLTLAAAALIVTIGLRRAHRFPARL